MTSGIASLDYCQQLTILLLHPSAKGSPHATTSWCLALELSQAWEGYDAMLSLSVIIAAALMTSFSAVSLMPRSAPRGLRRSKDGFLLQLGAGILALASVVLAVNIQLGVFR